MIWLCTVVVCGQENGREVSLAPTPTPDPAVDCTPSPLEDVIAAVCSHSREEGVQFRNETRSNHGVFSEG